MNKLEFGGLLLTSKTVLKVPCLREDGEIDENLQHLPSSITHESEYSKVIQQSRIADKLDLLAEGYTSLERGDVRFNLSNKTYIVRCSRSVVNDLGFRRAIVSAFHLPKDHVEFIADIEFEDS